MNVVFTECRRIASDIRSYYVYLAGNAGAHTPVNVAIWDSRTRNFVASAPVSDADPAVHSVDRVNLAVDASDRFCVAWAESPTPDFINQIAARVMQFDGTNITYLTHSFFPFVNYDPDGSLGLTTLTPSVATTTRQICIAAKGTVNSTNNPAGGPNTAAETTLYTVISTPVGAAPTLTAVHSGNSLVISWPASVTGFTLESTDSLPAPGWTTVGGVVNNSATITIGPGNKFYRLRQ